MKKIYIALTALIVLILLASCYSTTYVDENKFLAFNPGKGEKNSYRMIDGTLYSTGSSDSGDDYFCYYTKSQKLYDMFEFGLISHNDNTARVSEPQIEFFYGDFDANDWTLAGRWNSESYEHVNDKNLPIVFVKENIKEYAAGFENDGSGRIISGRIYIKKHDKDYKITYTTESGEKISSYFRNPETE